MLAVWRPPFKAEPRGSQHSADALAVDDQPEVVLDLARQFFRSPVRLVADEREDALPNIFR